MVAKHKATGVDHTLTPEEWEALQASGHSENFDIVSESDYEPDELKLPGKTASPKAKATELAEPK